MVRRDWVKQISERDVGMFDILVFSSTTTQEIVFHMIWTCEWKKKEFLGLYFGGCVSCGASNYCFGGGGGGGEYPRMRFFLERDLWVQKD